MPKPSKKVQAWKDADDILHILTGVRMHQIGERLIEYFGYPAATRKIMDRVVQDVEGSPYSVLELHDGASMTVVDAAYKVLARRYHPDSGTHKDEEKMKAINNAYDKIKKEKQGK